MKCLQLSSILTLFVFLSLFSCTNRTTFEPELIPVEIGAKWGFVNSKGEYVINPQFKSADYFFSGLARVKNNEGLYGYIDQKGDFIIGPRFKFAENFSENLACTVEEGDYIKFLNPKGEVIIELKNADYAGNFHCGLAKVKFANKWGFMNAKGESVIHPQYSDVQDFTNNMAAVERNLDNGEKLWGYINTKGESLINPQFKVALPFSGKLASCSIDGKEFGYIGLNGNYVINPQFKEAYPFSNGLAVIKKGSDYGLINHKGHMVVNPQFDDIDIAHDGKRIPVKQNRKIGYVDKNGKYLINPQFDKATKYWDDFAIVKKAGKYGFIDKKGKYKVNPQFNDIVDSELYALYGPAYYFEEIKSDFFNIDLFLDRFLTNDKILSIDSTHTSTYLMEKFEIDKSEFSKRKLKIENSILFEEIVNTNDSKLKYIFINFKNEAYESIPVYESYTDFWGNKKNKIAKYNKTMTSDLLIESVESKIVLRQNGEGKAALFVKELIESLSNGLNISCQIDAGDSTYHLFSDDSAIYIYIKHYNSTIYFDIGYDRVGQRAEREKLESKYGNSLNS